MFCCEAKTQTEYITNGSFEQIDSCNGCIANLGFDVFEWSGCKGWSNPIYSSSDLFCTNGIVCTLVPPNVGIGFQYPNSGNNMAGFFISDSHVINYREYIQNNLSQTLKTGINYEITMFVSSRNSVCSISEIGVKFFSQKYSDNNALWLTNLVPDAVNDTANYITDSLGWQKITMHYRSNGSENYMVIGCFADSVHLKYTMSNCDTTFWNGGNYASDYIFIDDVSIIDLPFQEPVFPNIFTPNNDGVNDVWEVDLSGYENINFDIYNRWGNKIYKTKNNIIIWDSRTTSGEECSDGIYYYVLEALSPEKEKININGFIQLVR
jgi:gliding motility-associated-like protein